MATLQSNAVQISIVTDGAYVEQDTEKWSVKESTTFSASSSTKVVERVAVAVAAAAALHRAKPRVARKEPTSRKSASIVPPIDESYFLACRAGLECVLNQDKKQLLLYRPNHRWLIESSDNPPG